MSNMDKVSFPYRATTHLAFLHVVGQSGAWAKHGLDVNYDWQISKSDAHRAVASGDYASRRTVQTGAGNRRVENAAP